MEGTGVLSHLMPDRHSKETRFLRGMVGNCETAASGGRGGGL